MIAEHHPDEDGASEQKAKRFQRAGEDGQPDYRHALFLKTRLKLGEHTKRIEIHAVSDQHGEVDKVILNSAVMGAQVKQQYSGSGLIRGHAAPLNDSCFFLRISDR